MDVLGFARAWSEAWARAWRTHDAELIGSLYADDAVFRSHPFREEHLGSEGAAGYASWAFEDESESPRVWFAEPRVVGSDRASVEYWAISTDRSGTPTTIGGVALLRFAPDGRVADQRDYWNSVEGEVEPYEAWDPA